VVSFLVLGDSLASIIPRILRSVVSTYHRRCIFLTTDSIFKFNTSLSVCLPVSLSLSLSIPKQECNLKCKRHDAPCSLRIHNLLAEVFFVTCPFTQNLFVDHISVRASHYFTLRQKELQLPKFCAP